MNKIEKGQKISVVIPCYNQGKYVDDAVNSVLNQSYKNFEIIIINDGSTDKYTNSLLEDYKRPHTKIYHTKNQGLASTRNYGFELSTGDFIQFLDADDFLDEKKFEEQLKEFKEDSSLGVSYTNYKYFYEETKQYSESQMQDKLGEDPFYDFVYKWQRGLSLPIHCALFRRSVFDNSTPFIKGFKAVEDWIMWVSIAKRKAKFKYLNKDLVFYRIQPNNMTRNKDFMLYWSCRAVSYMAEDLIEKKDLEKFNSQQEKYIKYLVDVFYISILEDQFKAKEKERREELEAKHSSEQMELKEDLGVMRLKIEKAELELDLVTKSKAYRLGNLLLWLPRRVRSLIDVFAKITKRQFNLPRKKMKLLIYTDSRGDNIPGHSDYDHYVVRLSRKYIVERYLCPEKWTTTLDFIELLKNKNIEDYDFIVLHTGIVEHSPRHQQVAVNNLYKDKKQIFDEVFGERRMKTYLSTDFGVKYEGDKTINMYSLSMAKEHLIPKLKKIPNLIWVSSNKIVPDWNGNYWKPRPVNINMIESYSNLFISELGKDHVIDLMTWDNEQVKKYTFDNMHPNKEGSNYILREIEKKLKRKV